MDRKPTLPGHLQNLLDQQTVTLRAILEAINESIVVINDDQHIIEYNGNFIELWHIPEELLAANQLALVLDFIEEQIAAPEQSAQLILSLIAQSRKIEAHEIKLKDDRYFEFYITPLSLNNNVKGKVLSFHDITQRKLMEQQLSHQATHDLLTSLPNRTLLLDRIEQAIKQAKRNNSLIAVLFFDLDKFKTYNDTLGHNIGDYLLKVIAQRLKQHTRDSDTVARLGGDEFVIVLDNLAKEEDSILRIKKLLNVISDPIIIDNSDYHITTSIGVSIYPKSGENAEVLLKHADIAMYRAKELGRNNFQFYTEDMNKRASKRLELEQYLQQALVRNEFLLQYQPCIDLKTGNIVGAEALIRWQHPILGLVPPMGFIPLAEETGVILPIGEWLIRTASQQLKSWEEHGLGNMRLAVNLSGLQLRQRATTEIIKNALKEYSINPANLELEFSETTIIANSELSLMSLQKIQQLGVKITIDDFGTGYSSLTYLNRFPIDKIKIDRDFITYIEPNSNDTAIILAIISLGNKLNLRVVAKGVETLNQINFLKQNDCHEIQGYYFSRPISAKDCTQLMLERANLFDEKFVKIA